MDCETKGPPMSWEVLQADCVDAMREMESASVDAVVTDPPYGIGFMGQEWDAPTIARAAQRDVETRKDLGPHSSSRPGRAEPRSSSAFGNAASYAGPVSAGREWQEWCAIWAAEALRVLKPGGHLLAFGGSRTFHRLACAVEDAGFEIRDAVMWVHAQGFPKSLDVSKAMDKAAGAEREQVPATGGLHNNRNLNDDGWSKIGQAEPKMDGGQPATLAASRWQGWGTALKPSYEVIVMARKPFDGTVGENVLVHGTGALNIDAARVEMSESDREVIENMGGYGTVEGYTPNDVFGPYGPVQSSAHPKGRWPSNLALSHLPECEEVGTRKVKTNMATSGESQDGQIFGYGNERGEQPRGHADPDGTETVPAYSCAPGCPVAELDRQSGERISGAGNKNTANRDNGQTIGHGLGAGQGEGIGGDSGGASRFFYCSKAIREERNAGLDGFEERPGPSEDYGTKAQHPLMEPGRENKVLPTRNPHPTVKAIDLMRWLVGLVTPPGGLVLDPFCGSGSTGCAAMLDGFRFLGVEREPEYVEIARARIAWWAKQEHNDVATILGAERRHRERREAGQLTLE
jgi:DNA modification methylase